MPLMIMLIRRYAAMPLLPLRFFSRITMLSIISSRYHDVIIAASLIHIDCFIAAMPIH